MSPLAKNILSLITGFLVGGVVNMTLVSIGPSVIPLPEGADISTMEKMRESMKLFTPANFVFPFLAHALGTLVGAFVAAKLAVTHNRVLGMIVGVLFLVGGITAVVMLGGPAWFKALDLIVAYLPMAYLGGVMAGKPRPRPA